MPMARRAQLVLSKKSFMSCKMPGLMLLAKELPQCIPETLKCGRCPRHSKFAECTACQTTRNAWMAAMQQSSTHPSIIAKLYQDMLDHQKAWSDDRADALVLRRSMYHDTASGCYQCDDKCGSFWQALPVDKTGRHCKGLATTIFKFSMQANVFCGLGE